MLSLKPCSAAMMIRKWEMILHVHERQRGGWQSPGLLQRAEDLSLQKARLSLAFGNPYTLPSSSLNGAEGAWPCHTHGEVANIPGLA